MRKSRKLISLLLAVVLTLSCFACLSSVSAFATEGDTLKGDVDKNGRVEITDVTLIQLYVAKDAGTVAKFENGTYDLAAADVDGNGTIDIMDATFTQLIIAHAEPTTAEPTTVEPTEAPTTTEPAEPTTEAPTTEEPTEAPTTEPATTTEPAGEDIYVLAGSSNFVENGWSPDPASYVMTKGEDGVYSADVPNVAAEEGALYQVKVVQFVGGDPANAVWHGMDGTDLNYDFMLNADGTVTVTYNPETAEIAVKGDTVIPPVYKIDYITAVGGGQGNFLNGIVWDPADESNKMTEVSEGVYEITFEECDTNTDYQFKFAANGGWDINWGLATDVVYNTPMEAAYNGGNALLNYESEEEYFDVTLRLDITGWDTIKKTGAKITVAIEGAPEPTTEEPTTEAPTTEAPTTEAPTTEAPTTEAPTTEAPTTEPAAEDIYVLAGSSNFVETGWSPDPASYVMTKGEDGVYSVVVPEVAAEEGALYQVKVVQFVGGDPANAVWHGMDGTDLNYDFMLNADCDVTVTYNPETGEIDVTGDGVTAPVYKIDYITAVGGGQGNFLNGIVWDPADESNKMTEVSEGVYEITYEECDTNTDLQFKFAANGGWDINWGLATDVVYNTPMEAAYNGGNALLNYESEEEYFDVTLRLDITGWDTIKKTGAKITVAIEGAPEPTTEEPTTEAPTTEAPTTEAPTTEAPTTEAPTTEAPTTEAPTTEPAAEDIYVLAGSSNFVETGWSPDPASYVMTKGEDGVYSVVVPEVAAEEGALYQVKVVQFVGGDPANAVWHGMDGTDLNYDFMLNADCDVTVTYNPETGEIDVTGDGVTAPVYEIDSIAAVGNGQGNFLNGIVWDPAAAENKMEEVSEGVYEITFEECDTNTDYQFKFAANGGWDINWGLATDVVYNTPMEAAYNGGNALLNYESEEEYFDVTLRLDITGWDTIKKTGAKITVVIEETPEPTTEEPTTEAPTTEPAEPTTAEPTTVEPTTAAPEPTTVEPTTVEPTTVEPTTVEPTTEPATEVSYGVAGDASEIFGIGWDEKDEKNANQMTKGEDGVYSITYKDVMKHDSVSFKVVTNHSWNPSYGWGTGNFVFKVTDTCDVTIKFDPATETITVEGENVEIMNFSPDVIETMYVTGNDASVYTDPWKADSDKMTEVSKGVYEIFFEDVEDGDIQVKFCVNGSWTFNFGAGETKEVDTDGSNLGLMLNGDNIVVHVPATGKLTMQFDTTSMDNYGNGGIARFFFAAEEAVPAGE